VFLRFSMARIQPEFKKLFQNSMHGWSRWPKKSRKMLKNFYFHNIYLETKFGWIFLWIMATSATTQNWQHKKHHGGNICAHNIIYLHTPHCMGHIWEKWTNKDREYNSWGWLWFIEFSYIPELYTYSSGVTSLHRTRNTIARQIAGNLFN
jgi:hypothetical protein